MKFRKQILMLLLILITSLLFGCSKGQLNNKNENVENSKIEASTNTNDHLKVHYIDVGQADSILIQQGNSNMLIDAGNNGDADTIIGYIKSQGVTRLDYVIGTHPHEDHIGSMDTVIKTFNIGTIYMPKVTANTKTFEDVINAIKAKNLKITVPKAQKSFKLGNAECTILAPNSDKYEDLNNYSIVLKITFGQNKFLFEGDAEGISEKEMVTKGFDVSADVLKIGHHGSNSSSQILDKIHPQYAVINCASNNNYEHPNKETMTKLKQRNIKVYRTDECGTIVMESDGKNIMCNNKEGSYNSPQK